MFNFMKEDEVSQATRDSEIMSACLPLSCQLGSMKLAALEVPVG